MDRREILKGAGAGAAALAMGTIHAFSQQAAADDETVFELRVYHTPDGRLPDLMKRFREHTITIFNRHEMHSVAYWTPIDDPLKDRTLFYILRHPSRDAAKANWAAFNADPEWVQVRTASEANGKIVEKVDSTFLKIADFSPRI